MVVESSSMATKLGEDELELCLSLGGPFKKTESLTDVKSNAVRGAEDIDVNLDGETLMTREINPTWRKREAKQQQRSGEGGEYKRIRTECKGITNGVDLVLSFGEVGNGYGSGHFKEAVTIGSPISNSSSEISDPSSSAQQGGSCDFGKKSDQIKPVVDNIGTGREETVQSIDGSNDAVVVETQEGPISVVAKETRKPPKPRPNGNGNGVNSSLLPFAQMPCVTSTGDGPEGKTVNGFLYRYSKSEISIICVCHGTSFSPAEFIIHAGGTNVSHPLRHITVVPSTF